MVCIGTFLSSNEKLTSMMLNTCFKNVIKRFKAQCIQKPMQRNHLLDHGGIVGKIFLVRRQSFIIMFESRQAFTLRSDLPLCISSCLCSSYFLYFPGNERFCMVCQGSHRPLKPTPSVIRGKFYFNSCCK